MALTQAEQETVSGILEAQPDLRTQDVLREAGLPQKRLFELRAYRLKAGFPEPDTGRPRGKPGRKPRAQAETLEDDGADAATGAHVPTGPKRRGGPSKSPQSIAAPILPRIAHALMVGLQNLTYNATHGVAPMTAAEATAIAVPAVRIADRTLAKYVKKTGKVTPNQEDAALIAITVVAWAIGWITASVTHAPARPRPAQTAPTQTAAPTQAAPFTAAEASGGADLFTGSEPVASDGSKVAPDAGASVPVSGLASGEDGDLFAGSEPLAAGADATPRQVRPADPAKARASEQYWQAITPTDMGEALVG